MKIHPTMAGENLSSYEFVQEMTKRAVMLKTTKLVPYATSGPIRNGEIMQRERVAAFAYYQPLDLIVVAGSYTDEFTNSASTGMAEAIALVTIISIAVCVPLIYILRSSCLHLLVEMVGQMDQADLNTKLASERNDEIGSLQRGI